MRAWVHIVIVLTATTLGVGCSTLSGRMDRNRVQRYIRQHPERPGIIHEALRRGDIVTGMNHNEVALLLGPPAITRTRTDGSSVWLYDQPSQSRGTMGGSDMWALQIPSMHLTFDPSGKLSMIHAYERSKSRTQETTDPRPEPSVATPTSGQPPPRAPRRQNLSRMTTAEADTRDWPILTLNGVLLTADRSGAILNHTVVEAGESIAGVTVVAIDTHQVLLERDGVRILLETGQSTRSPTDP